MEILSKLNDGLEIICDSEDLKKIVDYIEKEGIEGEFKIYFIENSWHIVKINHGGG